MLYKCCTIFIANLAFFTYVHIHTHFSESNSDLKTKAPNQFLRKPTPQPPRRRSTTATTTLPSPAIITTTTTTKNFSITKPHQYPIPKGWREKKREKTQRKHPIHSKKGEREGRVVTCQGSVLAGV